MLEWIGKVEFVGDGSTIGRIGVEGRDGSDGSDKSDDSDGFGRLLRSMAG